MLFATTGQAWTFLATMYGGVGVGVLYDVSRLFRRSLNNTRVVTGIADALFWCTALALMALLLYWAESGVIRAYMLLGFACGWGLYELGISPATHYVHALITRIWRLLAKTALIRRLFK